MIRRLRTLARTPGMLVRAHKFDFASRKSAASASDAYRLAFREHDPRRRGARVLIAFIT